MTDTATAAQHLAAIRESWGDLLHAIGQPPVQQWPPIHNREWEKAADDTATGPQVGRLPLTLRQHPAPLNLDALDAALSIETALFDLADRIAASVQTPYATCTPERIEDVPDRWHFAGVRDIGRAAAYAPGSRALGLHWAACWIEDRLGAAEVTELHETVRGVLRQHAEDVIRTAHRTLLAALGRDDRATVLTDPCPWCHGQLTARTTSGDPWQATITCDTGPTCTAPTAYDDRARRTWHGRDLVQLYGALSAARSKETAA